MPRHALPIVCLLLGLTGLVGCKREPSFDERYASARKAIDEKAGELEKDISRRAAEASQRETGKLRSSEL